jgi:hypothetical protein
LLNNGIDQFDREEEVSMDLIKLSGSFETRLGDPELVHGFAASTRDSLQGVLFNERGTAFAIDGARFETTTVERLSIIVTRADGRDVPATRYVMQRYEGVGNYEGRYGGRELKTGELSVEAPAANPLSRLGQCISAILNIPLLEPATAKLEFNPMSFREAYDSLNQEEQYMADVVVIAALYQDILGPMRLDFNFSNAVIYRAVTMRSGEVSQVPWSISKPE